MPNSRRPHSRSTEPNTLDMGQVPTLTGSDKTSRWLGPNQLVSRPSDVATTRRSSPGLAPGLRQQGARSRLRLDRRGLHTDLRPIIPLPPPTGRDSYGHPPPV
ncbi:hypothetical protein ACLKA7_005512 [Drosophila subpalustris]